MATHAFARQLHAKDWPDVDTQLDSIHGQAPDAVDHVVVGTDRELENELPRMLRGGDVLLFSDLSVMATLRPSILQRLGSDGVRLEVLDPVVGSGAFPQSITLWLQAKSRARSAMAQHRTTGDTEGEDTGWNGGLAPFGFDVEHRGSVRRLVLRPEEAQVVKRAVRRVLDGATVGEVVRELNEEGLATRRGSEWRTTSMSRLLSSPVLAGWKESAEGELTLSEDGNPVTVGEALIDDEEWRELQSRLARTAHELPGTTLLQGLLVCGECGSPMHGRAAKSPTASYYCNTARDGGDCPGVAVSVQRLDEYLSEAVFARIQSARSSLQTSMQIVEERAIDTEAHVMKVESRAERLRTDRYERGLWDDDPEEYREQVQSVGADLASARGELDGLRAELEELEDINIVLDLTRAEWDRLELAAKSDIIHTVVESIAVEKAGQGKPFSEERVHIEWGI